MSWEKFKQRVNSMDAPEQDKQFYLHFLDTLYHSGFPVPRYVWPNYNCTKLNVMFHCGEDKVLCLEIGSDGTGTVCLESQPFNPAKRS